MSDRNQHPACSTAFVFFLSVAAFTHAADWPQLQGSALRSGNVPSEILPDDIGLEAAIPLTDAVLASPVVSGDSIYVVDAAGVVFAIDAESFDVKWSFATKGGAGNCNNVAAPAVAGQFLHVGTMAGYYYVFDAKTGKVIAEIDIAL